MEVKILYIESIPNVGANQEQDRHEGTSKAIQEKNQQVSLDCSEVPRHDVIY
jgi:hypothetical protein